MARDVADRGDGDAGVERGRLQLGVSEQHLDHANIDVLLEQMRGEAMPQRMGRHALRDSRQILGGVHGAVELAGHIGLTKFWPGNNQACGRAARHQSRKMQ